MDIAKFVVLLAGMVKRNIKLWKDEVISVASTVVRFPYFQSMLYSFCEVSICKSIFFKKFILKGT